MIQPPLVNTIRHTVDSITPEALTALYDRLEGIEAENDKIRAWHERCPDREPRARAEAAVAKVRALRDDLRATTGARWIADAIDNILDGRPTPDPTAVQEADRQMDADPHGLNAGMIVKAYRDHGAEKWVFRCWGTDTCDGWLSLDHSSQQSAERARDRHVAEEHPAEPGPCPACRRAPQAGLDTTEQHPDCVKEQR
jgi:hypothetical protein